MDDVLLSENDKDADHLHQEEPDLWLAQGLTPLDHIVERLPQAELTPRGQSSMRM